MSIVLYDDARARRFEPFALTRPISELRAGAELIRRRWEIALGSTASGAIAAAHLRGFDEPDAPPAATGVIPAGTVIANSRCAISLDVLPSAAVWHCDGRVAAVRLATPVPVSDLADGDRELEALVPASGPAANAVGWWLDEVWDLVRHLAALLENDIEGIAESLDIERGLHLTHFGRYPVYVERGAKIEPQVVFDCVGGPVLVRNGASVSAFTRLVGPCAIGRDSHILGGKISTTSVGDTCRVHGEVSHSLFVGQANKAHDGFLGHSVVGRWVNLGASTVTSNLKNTYGSVALWTPQGVRDTGMQFLGTLFGDHAKTAIGTRLTTGTVIGAGANVFGEGMTPKTVAPFAWGASDGEVYDVERFLAVVEKIMLRRNVSLSSRTRSVLAEAHARRWQGTE